MNAETDPSVSLHNVTETVPAEWADDGDRLCRVPDAVGEGLNDMARDRVRHPTGSEIRFVPTRDDAEIELTLSAPEPTPIRVFWGEFQPWQPTEIGPGTETLSLGVPERVRELTATEGTGRFDPRVCRILFDRRVAIALHDVDGDCRPPSRDEVPDRRLLAYGTSITEGAASSAPHLDYVSHMARELGYDALNLGCSGSAYCESAMAEHVADRDDWDVATLALSVNMANTGGFAPEEFHERAEPFVNAIAEAHPEEPIACVTLFPYHDDVTESGDADHAAAYRELLRRIVAESPHDNLSVVEGPEMLDLPGLGADLLHPGDTGMETIGERLARQVESLVE